VNQYIQMKHICLWLLCLCYSGLSTAETTGLEEGIRLYDQGAYEQAVRFFEREIVKNPSDSERHHWLGKSIGRVAEQSPWYEAFPLAKKSGKEMEKAVDLDPRNTAAVLSLLQFYEQAPALVGGGEDKARKLRERMLQLGISMPE